MSDKKPPPTIYEEGEGSTPAHQPIPPFRGGGVSPPSGGNPIPPFRGGALGGGGAGGGFGGGGGPRTILDEEEEHFDLESDGPTILDEAESYGIEAPFSCRGGVCCTCKAKVLKGAVTMDKNFTLTDSEIEEGFILTCQSHPNSEELTITYDE